MAKLQINNTDIITESSGNITYASGTYNGTIGSSATFPAGHVIQTLIYTNTGNGQTNGTNYAKSDN